MAPGQTWLTLFPHPDDELFMSGLLRSAAARGVRIVPVFATSGEKSGAGVAAAVRKSESRAALALLGLDPTQALWLDQPDSALIHHLPALHHLLLKRMRAHRPQVVWCAGYEGGHQDHDALSAACFFAFRQYRNEQETAPPPQLLEYSTYHADLFRQGPLGFPLLSTPPALPIQLFYARGLGQLYRQLKQVYASQNIHLQRLTFAGDWLAVALRGEPWRPVPDNRDYTRPPVLGPVAYQTLRNPAGATFREFALCVDRHKNALKQE